MTTSVYQPNPSGGYDTYLDGNPAHGNEATLQMNGYSSGRILIKFDISDIPAEAICSAASLSVWLNTAYDTSPTWTVYPILSANSNWTESGAVWATRNGSDAWAGSDGCSTSGTDYSSTPIGSIQISFYSNEQQISLTPSIVQSWFGVSNSNYGMLILSDEPTFLFSVFSSDTETETEKRPKLVVDYILNTVRHRRTFHGTRMGSRQGA